MITAIVLAAGQSSRMGSKNKMFLPFRGSTVLSNVIGELVLSDVDEIIVVMDTDEFANEVAIVEQVKLSVNDNATQGLTSSIQTGVKSAKQNSHFLICLGDMPLISFLEYNTLINSFLKNNSKLIIQPTFEKQRGNPILFPNQYLEEILALDSPNGCKPLVKSNYENIMSVDMPTDSVLLDIDTEEDYQTLLDRVS